MKIASLPSIALMIASAACGGAIATGDNVVDISHVQGSGVSSPLVGEQVTVVGIVTGDFQSRDKDDDDLGGFFVQQERSDANSRTSDGVFVYEGPSPSVDVAVGDQVRVEGVVQEYFGETQIAANTISVIGAGQVRPTNVTLPVADIVRNEDGAYVADLERFEGMLLHFEQRLTVNNLRFLERFGEVGLAWGGRITQFTNQNAANVDHYEQHRSDVTRLSIALDDGRRDNNPDDNRYVFAAEGQALRVGDSVKGLTGNLRFSRGSGGSGEQSWRIMPTAEPTFSNDNPRPDTPPKQGSLRVASFNVLNYFSTIDTDNAMCGPAPGDSCRGADSQEELDRQTEKMVTALVLLAADITGLMELENNADAVAILVDALNERLGENRYRYIDTGAINNGPIKAGFIYNASTVAPLGDFAILDSSIDEKFNSARNRPALAQSFSATKSGAVLTVVVNHFKSKGSACVAEGDSNAGDGQGNCNGVRTLAANALAEWITNDPTHSGDPDYLLIGDFNAYSQEDPIIAFKTAGLVNLLDRLDAPYSFVFDGQSGALDHAIATASLESQVAMITEWHINADEAPLHDYNLEYDRDPGLFDAQSPYRASDHDPIIVDLALQN